MSDPFVEIRNLRVRFPHADTDAVSGVSLSIAPGECLALVGESGSGKTMTALALLGLVPGEAQVRTEALVVAGVDASQFDDRQWRGIRGRRAGLVSQDALASLDPLRRVGREVSEVIEVHDAGVSRSEVERKVIDTLQRVAVPHPEVRAAQYPHELSGGLRQRALIASAIAGQPGLLIADEPTTALDSITQGQIFRLLAELKASGLALLLVSHDLRLVARLADRIAVMKGGEIVETATTSTLFSAPKHPYTAMLLAALPQPRTTVATTGAPVVLSAHNLVRSYRNRAGVTRAVNDVSLTLHSGATLGIVGESGSGKSTLARLLMAVERPDSGSVERDGQEWSAVSERTRRAHRGTIQLIDQNPYEALDPRWSVRRILGEAIALEGTKGRAVGSGQTVAVRRSELLRQVGLPSNVLGRRPHQLSGGQRQRVAIARALARRPLILICDEPVSALDASIQAQIIDLLLSLQRKLGLAIIMISHDLAVVSQMSDDILVMQDGRVVEQGTADQIVNHPAHPFTRALIAAANLH